MIMAVYISLSLYWYSREHELAWVSNSVRLAMMIGSHVAINLIISGFYYFRTQNEVGKRYWLSALFIVLIGFSACAGIMELTFYSN